MTLNANEELALLKVLDLKLSLTRKKTPQLQILSFYSSELKGTKQIAGCLNGVRNGSGLSDSQITRQRYFNSLYNQGLVEGDANNPRITDLAKYYLNPFDRGEGDEFWKGDGGNEVEYQVIKELARRLAGGEPVTDTFKIAWYGAQSFFEYVPPNEIGNLLQNRDELLFLFRINSNGWELGRYFRLDSQEREQFRQVFSGIRPTEEQKPSSPVEIAASAYKDAASQIQSDVRFRISGFLNAYSRIKAEMGTLCPRLDRHLDVLTAVANNPSLKVMPVCATVELLPHPHQLIVTGCPGSGKSYYVDKLTEKADYIIRTQFHPESSYFDFVGAYKPQPVYEQFDHSTPLEESDGQKNRRGKPLIDYRYVPGPLMRGLLYSLIKPDENVVVLIEELNRGNVAAVFGDILQLLDRNESGESRYAIEASPEQRAFFKSQGFDLHKIALPSNLYLWSTMNSADQGVFPLDTAFRRRWSYVYKGYTELCRYPKESSSIYYGGRRFSWDYFRSKINDALLELNIHEDKLIGPYFLTERQLASSEEVLQKLFLYLWDDVLRFRQELLFSVKSFSEVVEVWRDGKGEPLKVELSSGEMEGDIPLGLDDSSEHILDNKE